MGSNSRVTNSRTVARIMRCSLFSPKSIVPSLLHISPLFHAGAGPLCLTIVRSPLSLLSDKGKLVENLERKDPAVNRVRVGQVLETATRLFTERGYEAASIRDL